MKSLFAVNRSLPWALSALGFWLAATAAPVLAGTTAAAQPASSVVASKVGDDTPNKPNILLVLTDDIGIDQQRFRGYGGNSAPPMPNIESLQKAGLSFTNAWTMPECSTARGALYTGRYPFRTELEAALGPSDLANSMISPWEKTIPSLMSKAGYKTAIFGKFNIGLQGNNPYGLSMPHALGWDYFNGWLDVTGDPSSIDTTAGGVAPAGTYPNGYVPGSKDGGADSGACYASSGSCKNMSTSTYAKNPAGRACRDDGGIFVPNQQCTEGGADALDFETLSGHYVSPLVINDGAKVYSVPTTDKRARTFRNVEQTDAAIAWIRKQQKAGKPWFATVATATVHTPMQVPPVSTLPPDALDANGASLDTIDGTILIANQMIQAMDTEFGRLLVSTGLAKKFLNTIIPEPEAANTIIIYLNDNGSLGSQVRQPYDPYRAKGTPYQTGVWTPMVFAGSIVKTPGKNVTAMVNIADLYELIGTLGGVDVHKENHRSVDSVPMLPYFKNINLPSIRKYDFTLGGPNLQANGGINGPCQFPSGGSCSQIPVTKSVCEDNGGVWFGEGATGSYPTGSTSTPIPSDGFQYCCQVQVWIKDNGGTPLTVVPETGMAVRDSSGYKLVRNETNNYDADTNSCVETTDDELYVINEDHPPTLDTSPRMIPTPYNKRQQAKYDELSTYLDDLLASEPNCLQYGDGNDDGVVDATDLKNYQKMIKMTPNSSWYDVNTDGYTNSTDQQIIQENQGLRCDTLCSSSSSSVCSANRAPVKKATLKSTAN